MLVDIVAPVHNDVRSVERNVPRLYAQLKDAFPYKWKLVLVDHGSDDGSFWAARKLDETYPAVHALQVALPGRGRALKRGSQGLGDVFCYIDLAELSDASGDIARLAQAVAEGQCDIAVGRGVRGAAGRFVSGLYHLSLKLALNLPVSDAQCPFKALSRQVALEIVPRVGDEFWFFDTELLVLAQASGWRVRQVEMFDARPHRAGLEEPLPDLMRRILDLRRRLREQEPKARQSAGSR